MKNALFAPLLLLSAMFSFSTTGQETSTRVAATSGTLTCQDLEDKQYEITVTIDDKVDGKEVISFKNLHIESSELIKSGFAASPFMCEPRADGSVSFATIMTSEKEGEMQWRGVVTENLVQGTILWTKAGQANITYNFDGPRKL